MITIENETLRVTINEVGALLTSVYLKKKNIEALWQADDKNSWPFQDVVMFPFIGVAKYSLDGVLHELREGARGVRPAQLQLRHPALP